VPHPTRLSLGGDFAANSGYISHLPPSTTFADNRVGTCAEGQVPLLTVKVKAKRRPWWVYAVSAISSVPISAFWAWVAHSAIGLSSALAFQIFVVFSALSVLFCPLLYLANEKQVRNHASKALITTATAFVALFSTAVLYFIAKHEGDTFLPTVYGIITIGLGVYISLFAIRYEFE
jgi:hypothetical protein